MGLFIPTSGDPRQMLADRQLRKGQLYNLLTNEKMSFQFNPEVFSWEQPSHWAEAWRRNLGRPASRQYIGQGEVEFDLRLLYITDPGAPTIEHNLHWWQSDLANLEFNDLRTTIDRWRLPRPAVGYPDPILVVLGDDIAFECHMASISYKITDWFRNLSVREALIEMELFGWPSQPSDIQS